MSDIDYQSRDDFSAERKRTGLGALFGPSKDEVWRQLAERLHGQFVTGGGLLSTRVAAHIEHWTITLDTYDIASDESRRTYTRLRAPYVNRDGFRFSTYQLGLFTALGDLFSGRRIRTGDQAFDREFVIKANNKSKAIELLADAGLRERIRAQPKIWLQVIDDEGWFPDGVDELLFTAPGVIKNIAALESLFDLFVVVLNRLCRIGSADEADPGVWV